MTDLTTQQVCPQERLLQRYPREEDGELVATEAAERPALTPRRRLDGLRRRGDEAVSGVPAEREIELMKVIEIYCEPGDCAVLRRQRGGLRRERRGVEECGRGRCLLRHTRTSVCLIYVYQAIDMSSLKIISNFG